MPTANYDRDCRKTDAQSADSPKLCGEYQGEVGSKVETGDFGKAIEG